MTTFGKRTWWDRFTSRFLPATKFDVTRATKEIMSKLSELNTTLTGIADTLTKVQAEVQTLKDSLSNVDIPADAQASLDKLVALSKAIDDINPDAPPPPPAG